MKLFKSISAKIATRKRIKVRLYQLHNEIANNVLIMGAIGGFRNEEERNLYRQENKVRNTFINRLESLLKN